MQEIHTTEAQIPDIRDIILTLWRRRGVILTVAGIIIVLGLLAILARPDNYRAATSILIEDQNINLADFSDVTAGAKFDERTVLTEVNVLTSPSLALETIRATRLNQTKEFEGDTPEDSVSSFLSHLEVKPQGTSRVIEIAFSSSDPQLAAEVANAHVKSYSKFQIAVKTRRIEEISHFFEDKVRDLKTDVTRKSQAIQAYRAQENLVFGRTEQELVYEQISNLSEKLEPVVVHKFDVQSRLEAIEAAQKSGNPNAVVDIVNSPLIQNLKQQASQIRQQAGAAALGPNHPKRRMVSGESGQINAAIATEIGNIKSSLKNDELATIAQEKLLRERLAELETQANAQRSKMITLENLTIERDASQKLLDSFLENYETVQSQVSFARSNAVQISPATPPSRTSGISGKLLLLAVTALAGCAALASVFALEIMRGGIRNFEDLKRMGQNTLGVLPKVDDGDLMSLHSRNSTYREAVRRIYMSSLMNSGAKTVLVTSALPQEGRTRLVTSLGAYLSSLGHNVIAIDADFYKPALSGFGTMSEKPGLADVLNGQVGLDQILTKDASGLTVLPAGKDALASPDLLRSERFNTLLEQLKSRYSYVLIDSGPILSHSESSVIAAHTDGVIVIVEWLKTSRQNLGNLFALLKKSPVPILGVVLNKVDIGRYKKSNSGSDFLLPKIG